MAETRASISIGAKDDTGPAFSSIQRSLQRLQIAAETQGKSASSAKLYELAVRGASAAQLDAAKSSLAMSDAYKKGIVIGDQIKTGLLAVGAIAATALVASYAAFDVLISKAAQFQDLSETTGASAEGIASIAVAAATAGVSMESVAGATIKLTKNLTGVDDESKAAGSALAALGINISDFKKLDPVGQFDAIGKALAGFADGAGKTAVAVALYGKAGAEQLKVFKAVEEQGGRQVILTAEQIRQADDYKDAQSKSRAELLLYASAIATQALPAVTDLTGALGDVVKELLAVSKESTDIRGSTGVKTFAEDAALAIAELVDVAYNAVGALLALKGSVNVIAADTRTAFNFSTKAFGAFLPGDVFRQQTEDLKTAVADREKVLAAANARYERLSQGLGLRDKLAARIAATNAKNSFPIGIKESELGSLYDTKPKPKLKFDGALGKDKAGKNTADAEAKAQLAFDLEQIRKASEAQIGTFSNAEKIMEARRAATLVSESDYYASKLGFLNLNSQAQEHALQQEIDRLSQEKLTGKDKIDNLRKIAEAQAKLDKVRENSVANIEVLKTQEVAANAKIAQSYVDATVAAQAYIDTVNKQNEREISGIGKGDRFRTDQAGLSKIEDKQTTQRQGLEGDLRRGQIDKTQFDTYLAIVNDTYAKEVQAYEARTAAIREKQADWLNGASEAFANYQANAENAAGNSAAVFQNAFDSMTDGVSQSIASAIVSGKSLEDSLKSVALNVADAFIAGFIKIQIQKLFIDKAAAVGYAGTIAAQSQAMVAMAGLNAFASTAAIPYVGPSLAPAAAAGAIAIAEGFALAATAAASLSIASARAGFDIPAGVNPITQLHEKEMVLPQAQANVIRDMARSGGNDAGGKGGAITIVNNTSARIGKVTEQRLSNGDRALIIEEAVAATAAQMSDPNSRTSRSMGRNFAVARSR